MEDLELDPGRPIFRDVRRYYCDYCGICRSKKSLMSSHVLTRHKEEIDKEKIDGAGEPERAKSNTCEECGASFKKPAHLKQHMQSHSLERPYECSVEDCHASYRRKDHLTRHFLLHQGKLFECSTENCDKKFAFQGNMTRHVKEFHSDNSSLDDGGQKQYVCQEPGCGKLFRFASKLFKLESVEALCLEPGCMKHFSNIKCLKAHVQSCHQHITCDICGIKHLKKNIKRHLRMHEGGVSSERIKCHFKDCLHTFSTKTNLAQHVKAVHFEVKPFTCSFPDCGMRFSFKHVRDNHEKNGLHVYTPGDFEESDEQFRSRPRGGRKRKCPTVEMLIRKRVTPPNHMDPIMNHLSSLEAEQDEISS
ncbi:transcription factor IIIA-like isoform X2 [Tripterygium wilfordii]|uniref:transcription factor IIIA-like isoform X2 n=1 Tax=Tripterygium wilfordii TaxID=458696 RepID=UPI0018F83EA3|nr:transcription factor IIIA-like isoform X2 [Tripterygium wilfordii]